MSTVDSPLLGWGTPTDDEALVPLNYASPALAKSAVVKTGPGILFGLTVTNTNAAAQFVQVFDAASVPADNAVPLFSKSVPSNDAVGFQWIPGRTFLTGIVVCNSSTANLKTIGAADCLFDVQYL